MQKKWLYYMHNTTHITSLSSFFIDRLNKAYIEQ